jgi:hypothetical protein
MIDETLATKVLMRACAAGLGRPTPGQMCVEAAVCHALGLPHNDAPPCVGLPWRNFKIILNDSYLWPSRVARAKGLRRLAIAQLGSNILEATASGRGLAQLAVRKWVPRTLRLEARARAQNTKPGWLDTVCEQWGAGQTVLLANHYDTRYAYYADMSRDPVSAASYAAMALIALAERVPYMHRDGFLSEGAEDVVQLLIEMKSPGTEYLYLTEKAPSS